VPLSIQMWQAEAQGTWSSSLSGPRAERLAELFDKDINALGKSLLPFVCGFVACPASLLLHELGHCVAGVCLGFKVKLRYAATVLMVPNHKDALQAYLLHTGAGPLVTAVLAGAGLLWLHRLRKHRRDATPTLSDWLATSLILNAGRWFRGFTGPYPKDEAHISQAIGLPAWLLPAPLGLLAVIAAVAAVRLHPRGSRLFPFFWMGLGCTIGVLLWMRLLGPFLLP